MDEEKKGYEEMNSGHAGGKCGDTGKLREQRNAACQKLKLLGISQLIYGVIFLGVSIAQIAVAAQGQAGWPLMNPGPWIIAIMIIVAGALALVIWRKGDEIKNSEETPCELRKLLFGYWMVCHMTNCCLIGWATAFAITSAVQCADENSNAFKYCVPDKETNIGLAATLAALCLLSLIVIVPAYCLYFRNAKAFGIKPWQCCGMKTCD